MAELDFRIYHKNFFFYGPICLKLWIYEKIQFKRYFSTTSFSKYSCDIAGFDNIYVGKKFKLLTKYINLSTR